MKTVMSLICCVALGACGAGISENELPVAGTYVVQPSQALGGSIVDYDNARIAADRRDTMIDMSQLSACVSMCTHFLAAKRHCISPDTIFEFHGPQNGTAAAVIAAFTIIPPPVSLMSKETADKWRDWSTKNYSKNYPELGKWYSENAAHLAGTMVKKMTGAQLHRNFGVPYCEGIEDGTPN